MKGLPCQFKLSEEIEFYLITYLLNVYIQTEIYATVFRISVSHLKHYVFIN
jgi:hypothetical protein